VPLKIWTTYLKISGTCLETGTLSDHGIVYGSTLFLRPSTNDNFIQLKIIMTRFGKFISLWINVTDTIERLKELITLYTGIATNEQELFHNGKSLVL
jgi:hypothetical protein